MSETERAAMSEKQDGGAYAMRVQRDAAHKKTLHLDTQNRVLMRHQSDIRAWLREAIAEFEAARDTDQLREVADNIHRRAVELLGEAEGLLE